MKIAKLTLLSLALASGYSNQAQDLPPSLGSSNLITRFPELPIVLRQLENLYSIRFDLNLRP